MLIVLSVSVNVLITLEVFGLICAVLHRLRKKNVESPFMVHVSLLEGHVSPSERQSTELAVVTTERWYMAPGVKRIDVRQNGIVGTLFMPPGEHKILSVYSLAGSGHPAPSEQHPFFFSPAGPGPFPAMLDMWGMGGGLVEYRSALCLSRGYASLSLAYIGHKDLPGPKNRMNVGDSYFKVR